MKTKPIFYLFLLFLTNCTTSLKTGQYTIPFTNSKQLVWKDGADSFAIFENGDIFLYWTNNNQYQFLYKRPALAKSIFKLAEESHFLETNNNIEYSELVGKIGPNRNHSYIKFQSAEKTHEIYWKTTDNVEDSPIWNELLANLHRCY